MDALRLKGVWALEHVRGGAVIDAWRVENDIVNAGAHKLLDVMFRNQTQLAQWFCGLMDNASFTAIALADTMGSHGGWIECDDYDEATRPEWLPGAPSARATSNATRMTFTINATRTIQGIFLTSGSAKNGTTGTLWSAVEFDTPRAVASGDELRIAYTLSVD